MKVKQIFVGNSLRNFNYLLINSSKQAVCIDPFDAQLLNRTLDEENSQLKTLLNTHHHPDHIKGNQEMMERWSIKPELIEEGSQIDCGDGYKLEVLFTPGHTLDHYSFLLKDAHRPVAFFSGDALFNMGIGHTKLGGDIHIYYETMTNILEKLDDSLILYPGHDYQETNLKFALSLDNNNQGYHQLLNKVESTKQYQQMTIGQEKQMNPFFFKTKDEFIKLRTKRDNW